MIVDDYENRSRIENVIKDSLDVSRFVTLKSSRGTSSTVTTVIAPNFKLVQYVDYIITVVQWEAVL